LLKATPHITPNRFSEDVHLVFRISRRNNDTRSEIAVCINQQWFGMAVQARIRRHVAKTPSLLSSVFDSIYTNSLAHPLISLSEQ
jgi:hypothetical protein